MEKKPWYKSKTLISLIIATVGHLAPKYSPLLDLVGPVLEYVGEGATLVGLVGAGIGRLKAETQVTLTKPEEGN